MSNRESWCAEKVAQLLNEELRILTLNEIKEHFLAVSQEEANETANILQLPIVFDCLNDSKSEQIDLACDVLTLCMSNLSLGESANRYGSLLERALSHPSPNVKIMALKELQRTASNPESISELNKQTYLITALVVCVGDDDIGVAQKASNILSLIGKTNDGLKQLLSREIKQVIAQTIPISDIVRYRIYEVLIDIASHSDEALQNLLPSGMIDSLISELDSPDPLLKLNVVEFLAKLAYSNHGLNFLESQGVIKKIISSLACMNEDPLAMLILPGFLKFFGNVAHWRTTEIFSEYPTAINVVFDIIVNADLNIGVAYDTLGYIASSNQGKYELDATGDRMTATVKAIGRQIPSSTTELRIRALQCVENLISVEPENQNNRVCSITQRWFNLLHENPITIFVNYSQNPFVDIRCAGLNVLYALSEQFWGQQLINNTAGLIEFFLDRRIETAKESKELKYKIVKALSVSSAFDESTLEKLQRFVKEGPFYVQAVTEVAIEGSG